MFTPHSSGNASSYHTYTEVKKNFMLKVSVSLGEFGNDIKKALEMEQDVTFAPPSRNMIALPHGMVDPGTLDMQGDDEDEDAFTIRVRLHREAADRYEQAVIRQKFD